MTHSCEHAKTIFLQAVDLPTEERAAYVDAQCGHDEALHREVYDLLQHHGQVSDAFLAVKRPGHGSAAATGDWSSERPGTKIGDYKLLEQIGEGGMGEVWVADQLEPIRRRVAVKVIKAGMDSRMVLARFEAERQALALMDHPNIAKVLDAGTTDNGRPYFALELVKGTPITQFCDARKLSPRERLELFIPVCQAIQHAHQKGIIHRDIKPSNVLVALHDEKPVPKVIDFGVAKAIGQQLTEKTLYTGFGALIGTPAYMAPQQATFNQLDVDTRADVYALGVMLYELLAGSPPFEPERLKQAALDEILRLVREEEPLRPSARLSTSKTRATIAAVRQSDPTRLAKLFRGDLDWIVMKCLEKDRTRRYETANGLALDLQRYLQDEPVLACPPSPGYRLRKLVRRNQGAVVAASLILLALVGGIIGTTWGMIRSGQAKAVAENEAAKTQLSERAKSEQLWEALVAQARANRLSRRPGQRFETLEILQRATQMARGLDLPAEKFLDLRNGAIAALALPDLHTAGSTLPRSPNEGGFDFDESHSISALTDIHGACSIRRVADGVELHRLPGNGTPAHCRLSHDGKYVAVFSTDKSGEIPIAVDVWTLGEPTPRRLLTEERGFRVDFDRASKRIAIGSADGSIAVYELPSDQRIHRLERDTFASNVVPALHPTEDLVAVCSYGGDTVQLRDLRSGKVIASLPQGSRPLCLGWHPDGRTLAVGLAEARLVRLYDRETLQPIRTLKSDMAISDLAFNRSGDRLAVGGWSGQVQLFDVGTGRKLFATSVAISPLRFNSDASRLSGAYSGRGIGIWQVADCREFRTLVRQGLAEDSLYTSVSVSPDGRMVAAATSEGFGLWDLATGSEIGFVPGGGTRVVFEQSGSLLTFCPAGLFRWPVRKPTDELNVYTVGPPEGMKLPAGSAFDCSRDGRVLVTCARTAGRGARSAGGWTRHLDGPAENIQVDAGADIAWIAVSPDGCWVVTVTHSLRTDKVWDARDGKFVMQIADSGAGQPRFSPDGRWLATSVDGGRLFAVGTWEPGPRILAQAFTADGQIAAGEISEGRVRLVHVPTGRELATLEHPSEDRIGSLTFSPDGTRLVSFSNGMGKGIHVWDLRLLRQRLVLMGLDWEQPAYDPITRDVSPSSVAHRPSARFTGEETLVDWDTWCQRALRHARSKEWEQAIAAWSKAIELEAHHAYCWNGRGNAYSWLGQWDKALADYGAAVMRAPSDPTHWSNRASAFTQLGQYEKAVADCSKAIDLMPDFAQAWTKRANAYAALGEWAKSAANFEKAAALTPDDANVRYLLALARLQAGDHAGYRKVCSGMLDRYGESTDRTAAYWTAWSLALASKGITDWKPIVNLAGLALDAEPTNCDRKTVLGSVLYRAGEFDEAAKRLTEAEAAFQESKDAKGTVIYTWLFLAMTEFRRDQFVESNQWLHRAVMAIEQSPKQSKDRASGTWNRRLTLQLLRAEAESLIRQPERGPPPRELKQ